MSIELTIRIPALDHLADVLDRIDLRAVLDRPAPLPVVTATAEAQATDDAPLPEIPVAQEPTPTPVPEPDPVPDPEPVPAPEPVPEPAPEPVPDPEPAPTVGMPEIRRACAALRDAGKLSGIQQLLKEHGVKNLSALKPEQLASFVDGLRGLGAKL